MDDLSPDKENKTAIIVNNLFLELQVISPAFKQAWPTQSEFNQAKKSWVKAFIQSNFHEIEQIQYGINKFRLAGKAFIPTVGEFMELCKPKIQDYGLPETEEAFRISIRMNQQFANYKTDCEKTNLVVGHVISEIGTSDYRAMKMDAARKTFEYYYKAACQQFINGTLGNINKAIEDDSTPTEENEKQNNIVLKQYKNKKSHMSAMSAIRDILK